MKRFLLLCVCLATLFACSDDSDLKSGLLKPETTELTLPTSNEDIVREISLSGVTEVPTAEVDIASQEWCSAEIKAGEKKDEWKVAITAKKYLGNEERKAYVTIFSGVDEVLIKVVQSGRGNSVEMIVVNEGLFTKGTSALSAQFYDGRMVFDIFRDVNNKPLGDVAQSMTYINGYYFVVLNNSKQVKVIEPQTFKLVATIDYDAVNPGLPRFVQPISETEAVVSDLQRQLVKINTKEFKIVEYISIPSAIEKMQVVGNKLFCAVPGEGVGVFDNNNITGNNMRFVAGLEGGIMKTAKMIPDKNGKLWVMTTDGGKVILSCINPETETVERKVEIVPVEKGTEEYVDGCITGSAFFNRMDTDRTRGKLYFFMTILSGKKADLGAVFTLNVDEDAISGKPYRELPGLGMMFGMGISPDGEVYMCDCLDYTAQRGFLRQYKADGSVVSTRVGVYPRMVHFTEYDK